ncbi:MAG: rhodanese-like domain-containing protein [Bacteroidales bacterium]
MLKNIISNGILIAFFLLWNTGNAQETDSFESLNAEEFYVKMNQEQDAVIIDVRLDEDFKIKRIPGAVLASEPDKLQEFTDSLDRNIPLLVYCYDGERSSTACEILSQELNFNFVYNLRKGLERWEELGFPVDKDKIDKIN